MEPKGGLGCIFNTKITPLPHFRDLAHAEGEGMDYIWLSDCTGLKMEEAPFKLGLKNTTAFSPLKLRCNKILEVPNTPLGFGFSPQLPHT